MSQITQQRFQLWGWILFIASAIFFMASSIRAGDPLSLIGGTFFLVACFIFLVPLLNQLAASHSQAAGQVGASSVSPPRKYFRINSISRLARASPESSLAAPCKSACR